MPGRVRKAIGALPPNFTREDALALGRSMFDELTGSKTRESVTFDEARRIVTAHFAPTWTHGTFVTQAAGRQNDHFWLVVYGNKEALVDGKSNYVMLDAPVALVDKSTGELVLVNYIANMQAIEAMTPTG